MRSIGSCKDSAIAMARSPCSIASALRPIWLNATLTEQCTRSFAAGIVQGFGQRLGFELKLNPARKFSERTQARAHCQAQIYRLLQGGLGLRQMRQHGNGLLQV